VLRYVLMMTEPDIARTVGVPRGTVASRLKASHDQLRTQLTRHDGSDADTVWSVA
jgi:DNA-directed RNA polymerase specialized sigma24 family protein